MTALLTTHQLEIGYTFARRRALILGDINVTLHGGELTCLIGPNGAGKSTLMRTLAGMQTPLAGQVHLGTETIHQIPASRLAKQLAIVLTERVDVGNLSSYALAALGRHPFVVVDVAGLGHAGHGVTAKGARVAVSAAIDMGCPHAKAYCEQKLLGQVNTRRNDDLFRKWACVQVMFLVNGRGVDSSVKKWAMQLLDNVQTQFEDAYMQAEDAYKAITESLPVERVGRKQTRVGGLR